MGIGGGSGGGGFKLEKTWRATGVGTTTFNSPSNINIPFGKYEILVSGRGGTGNPDTPGNIASYNPFIPSTIGGYNTAVPSTISGSNPTVPGNATGSYNPGSGGNLAGYSTSGGNPAGYNSPTPGGVNVTQYVTQYVAPAPGVPGNLSGSYNPPSGGNIANYNPTSQGTNYNPPTPGVAITEYTYRYFNVNMTYTNYLYYNVGANCPTPKTYYTYFVYDVINYSCTPTTIPGNIAGYNPPVGGTANYNPRIPGNQNYNPPTAPYPGSYTTQGPSSVGFSANCPTPFNYYQDYYAIYNEQSTTFYETITYACTPVPGSPGTAIYNPITYSEVYNPFVSGNQNYNSPTGGNSNYNAAIPSTANYNPSGGQNANYNSPTGGVAGTATTVLGVYFPGGPIGTIAPYVAPTRINRYAYPDDATYPVDVPPGGYITIERK